MFVGCTAVASFAELLTGYILEQIYQKKWWDYSKNFMNLGGYICLRYSMLWGAMGVIMVRFIIPVLLDIFTWIPYSTLRLIAICVFIIGMIDAFVSVSVACGIKHRINKFDSITVNLGNITSKLTNVIFQAGHKRVAKAYPDIENASAAGEHSLKSEKADVFAYGCGFYKVVSLFFIAAFLGDIIETVFCYYTMGYIMSRSSVVYGPFSIVWGVAIAIATAILHQYRNKSDGYIFVVGTVFGGVYEYVCSVFTEIVFGTVFGDYSHLPFNLGGRINLLYCFFWGIAAVIWIKVLYPLLSNLIEKIPMKIGKIVFWILLVFMIFDMAVSAIAMKRYSERSKGIEARTAIEEYVDEHFDDLRMQRIYPNAVMK